MVIITILEAEEVDCLSTRQNCKKNITDIFKSFFTKTDILEVAVGHRDRYQDRVLVRDRRVTDHLVVRKNLIRENVLDRNLEAGRGILETDQILDQEDPAVDGHIIKSHHIKADQDIEEVHLNIKNHVRQVAHQ